MSAVFTLIFQIGCRLPEMKILLPLTLILLTSCASSDVQKISASTATVHLVSIDPPAGSVVNADTILTAEVAYAIENFDPAASYSIAPLFDTTRGEGQTFNALKSPTEAPRLWSASGRVRVIHRLRPEWSRALLARPVRVTFFVMIRTGPQRTQVIGQSETIEFGPAEE
jgi:hypothetical protein